MAKARGGDADAAPVLLRCLDDCASAFRRASAARLLARFREQYGVLAGLVRAAVDGEPLVRSAATWAIAERGAEPRAALIALQRAAEDEFAVVRQHAGWGLREVDLTDAAEHVSAPLERAMNEWVGGQLVEAEDPESQHALGLFWSARGDADKAERAYRSALRLAPNSIPARHNLAVLLVDAGRADDAVAEFEKVVEGAPGFAPASYSLGMLHAEAERWEDAIDAFAAAMHADPKMPGVLYGLSDAYARSGDGYSASRILEASLKFDELHQEALIGLLNVSVIVDDTETAKGWARVIADQYPDLAGEKRIAELLDGEDSSSRAEESGHGGSGSGTERSGL